MEITGWNWGINIVLAMFAKSAHANVYRYFDTIEAALRKFNIEALDVRLVAYATIRAETAGFAPILEYESKHNTLRIPHELVPYGESAKYNLYEFRNKTTQMFGHRKGGLGNDQFGDGERFMGRGFVQITGKSNYRVYGQMIGLGTKLLENPELANDPTIAAELLAAYIRDHHHQIAPAIARGDLKTARRAVNGGSNGLKEFEVAYRTGFNLTRKDARDLRSVGNIA